MQPVSISNPPTVCVCVRVDACECAWGGVDELHLVMKQSLEREWEIEVECIRERGERVGWKEVEADRESQLWWGEQQMEQRRSAAAVLCITE